MCPISWWIVIRSSMLISVHIFILKTKKKYWKEKNKRSISNGHQIQFIQIFIWCISRTNKWKASKGRSNRFRAVSFSSEFFLLIYLQFLSVYFFYLNLVKPLDLREVYFQFLVCTNFQILGVPFCAEKFKIWIQNLQNWWILNFIFLA